MKKIIIFIGIALAGIGAFYYTNVKKSLASEVVTAEKESAYPNKWNYKDKTTWGKKAEVCKKGQFQSPINIELATAVPSTNKTLNVTYNEINLNTLTNVGYAVNAIITDLYITEYDNNSYQLVQFHFHADGEHTFDGKTLPLELHLVHSDTNDNLAVIGILFKEGEHNPTLQQFLDNAPTTKNSQLEYNNMINISELLPTDRSFFSYDGSLTTPKCYEGVKWIVMKNPIDASAAQIEQFLQIRKGQKNNRSPQELQNRVINYTGA